MSYKGSCHCGRVKFEAEGELKQVMACNCSLCFYTFNKHFIKLEGVHFAALAVKHFDGRSL